MEISLHLPTVINLPVHLLFFPERVSPFHKYPHPASSAAQSGSSGFGGGSEGGVSAPPQSHSQNPYPSPPHTCVLASQVLSPNIHSLLITSCID